jgi:hypothetical protein
MRCLTSCVTLTYKAVKWAKILTKRGTAKYAADMQPENLAYWPQSAKV